MPGESFRFLPVNEDLQLSYQIHVCAERLRDGINDQLLILIPSGIQNEQLVVDSIAQTLGANVNLIRQLKVLIHGQEAETLAGHLDLSGLFTGSSASAAATPVAQPLDPGQINPTTSSPAQPAP